MLVLTGPLRHRPSEVFAQEEDGSSTTRCLSVLLSFRFVDLGPDLMHCAEISFQDQDDQCQVHRIIRQLVEFSCSQPEEVVGCPCQFFAAVLEGPLTNKAGLTQAGDLLPREI